jgi:hypothetical protein
MAVKVALDALVEQLSGLLRTIIVLFQRGKYGLQILSRETEEASGPQRR